jgi:DUF4097 and DUF4098 domain-containing protein YvlB
MHEFPCTEPVLADVRVSSGRCEIAAEQRDTVTVDVRPVNAGDEKQVRAAEETTVEFDGRRLTVKAPESGGVGWLFGRHARLRVSIRLPLDSELDVRVASADLSCTGRYAAANLNTASGNVDADEVTGDASVVSASGDVRLRHVGGAAKVTTASGDLTVGYAGRELTHHGASGDTTLGETHGDVKVRSASGDVRIGAAFRGSVRLTTASGDVRIGVPAGTGVWLDLTTASGTTTSDLAVGADAPLTGHDLELRAATASGDIEITRVTAATADS